MGPHPVFVALEALNAQENTRSGSPAGGISRDDLKALAKLYKIKQDLGISFIML